jgi:hypothetical protein
MIERICVGDTESKEMDFLQEALYRSLTQEGHLMKFQSVQS